jgi:hypothetical protein
MKNLTQYIECINCNESYVYTEPSHDRLDYCDECRLEIIASVQEHVDLEKQKDALRPLIAAYELKLSKIKGSSPADEGIRSSIEDDIARLTLQQINQWIENK